LLEDEKVLGTCYFSIGDSGSLPGSAQGMRITGVLAEPTLEIGKLKFIEAGEFLFNDE
jgi:hypothetical protein